MEPITIGGKWLNDLNAELSGSDRACAVLAGAILDDRLKTLFERFLKPARNPKSDKLLGRSGAIESFSIRIELASRLTLISESMRLALDVVREIRNDAAHLSDFSFDDDSVKDRVANLMAAHSFQTRAADDLTTPYDTNKGQFVFAVAMLVGALELETREVSRINLQPVDLLRNYVSGRSKSEA